MFDLTTLEAIIAARSEASAEKSYTKSLLDKGTAHCAKKFGEEAVELVIASVAQEKQEIIGEAADVFYHLLVLLKAQNIDLHEVYGELARRTGQTGLEEKASRISISK